MRKKKRNKKRPESKIKKNKNISSKLDLNKYKNVLSNIKNIRNLKLYLFGALVLLILFSSALFYKSYSRTQSKKRVNTKQKISSKDIRNFIAIQETLFIDPNTLLAMLDRHDKKLVIIDMRTKQDYVKEHLKEAENVPLSDIDLLNLNKTFSKYKDKTLVFYSDNNRSPKFLNLIISLIDKGYVAKILTANWTKLRYFRNLWLPESQWNTFNINKYFEIKERF